MEHSGVTRFSAFLRRALENEPEYSLLAEYLELKEKGLRKQSLAKLNQFVAVARLYDAQKRRDLVRLVCQKKLEWRSLDRGPFHSDSIFDSYPLTTVIMVPTLDEWIEDEPQNPEPLKWKGIFYEPGNHWSSLQKSFEFDPNDEVVARHLIRRYWSHLDETDDLPMDYLGDPVNDLALIGQMERCVKQLKDDKLRSSIAVELRLLRQWIEDWVEFARAHAESEYDGSFLDWCRLKGRRYHFMFDRGIPPDGPG